MRRETPSHIPENSTGPRAVVLFGPPYCARAGVGWRVGAAMEVARKPRAWAAALGSVRP